MMLIAQGTRDVEQRHAVQIEHRLGLRMIPRLHAVARQAQHVADPHGGTAQNVALNRDAVLVAAGDLHDGRVADPGQQGADRQARHVAIRAAAVGGVDGIDVAVEHARPFVHILRVRRIRRRELGGDGEAAGAQHALEAPRRGMPGQDRQRIARNRFVLELHGAPLAPPLRHPSRFPGRLASARFRAPSSPVFSRVTRSHEERPLLALIHRELHLAHRLDSARQCARCLDTPPPRRSACPA